MLLLLVLALHLIGQDEWQNRRGAVDPSRQHFKTRRFAERKACVSEFIPDSRRFEGVLWGFDSLHVDTCICVCIKARLDQNAVWTGLRPALCLPVNGIGDSPCVYD
ncbi:hypothetical protein SUGI_0384720 [Cryptomeria japonica]|nr:hypothetical protein SUGI_0384720 [Cryptomeria japonica]